MATFEIKELIEANLLSEDIVPEGATHIDEEGNFGTVTVAETKTQTIVAKDAPPPPELLSLDKDSIVGRDTFKNWFGRTDQSSYVTLSDGTTIESDTGSALNTSEEVAQVAERAQEYITNKNVELQEQINSWNNAYTNKVTTGGEVTFNKIELPKKEEKSKRSYSCNRSYSWRWC